MILYYDLDEGLWFHTHDRQYVFGYNQIHIHNQNNPTPSSIPFSLHLKGKNELGPIVGIMAGQKDYHIIGNTSLFIALQKQLLEQGGMSIVFPPEGLHRHGIDGYLYIPRLHKWIRVKAPLPHVIYNRVPTRKIEHSESFKNATTFIKEKGIPFFNPMFMNKFQFYQLMMEEPKIQSFLPETIIVSEKVRFDTFLKKHGGIYLKPCHASQGRGIIKLRLEKDESIQFIERNKSVRYPNYELLWEELRHIISKRSYLAQKEVNPLLTNGSRFDFRILAHFDGSRSTVTGVGVRQSDKDSLTTHLTNGGRIVSYDEVKNEKVHAFIEEIVELVGRTLSKRLGFFGEFSIDAGLTKDGRFIIYEANSKPMSFDEEAIEKERINRLVQLFNLLFA